MLGQMIAIETERFVQFDEMQALRILLGERHAVRVDMVEDAELHVAEFRWVTMSLPRRAEM